MAVGHVTEKSQKVATVRKRRVEVCVPRDSGLDRLRGWLARKGWRSFEFQETAWAAHQRGESGLINVPTGAGKTYAVYFGPLAELIDERREGPVTGLRVLFVTPLRAMSRDIELALKQPVLDLGVKIKVESRTGDTSSAVRARQRVELPHVLITTPESLSLLLTRDNCPDLFAGVRSVIVDEWHELLSSKRGTQTELALARLRRIAPGVRTWALSATLSNLEEAACAAVGVSADVNRVGRDGAQGRCEARIIRADVSRPVEIKTLIPGDPGSIPWAGHLGLKLIDDVLGALEPEKSTLIFANTRSQAELWHNAIRFKRPEWGPFLGLHHGSIDRAERERIERGLKSGEVRIVVCTSSLDLGVDFAPVERVVQLGSAKGIARLLQRAGRSGHRPGASCSVLCVPTQWIELVEAAAVKRAVEEGQIEPRLALSKPLDVLTQHMVSRGLGGGFTADELFEEVRSAWSYRDLTRQEFDWALELVRHGGATLRAYPEYTKVVEVDGRLVVENRRIAQLHRLNLGTITGEATVDLRYSGGKRVGSIEEEFIAIMRPGTTFLFAGRTLEFVRMGEAEAIVRPSRKKTNFTPHWAGTKLPISERISEQIRSVFADEAGWHAGGSRARTRRAEGISGELAAAGPLMDVQARLSRLPCENELLVEVCQTREGHYLSVFPFEGQLVHAGLAALLSLRLSRRKHGVFALAANDYGLSLVDDEPYPYEELVTSELFSEEHLAEDAAQSASMSFQARRQFREIARVAGLVFQTYPGARKSGRQLQASSSLLFDVFAQFDPANLLLEQARREVLERHFERSRLGRTLARLRRSRLVVVRTERPTPLSFPLMVEVVGTQVSPASREARIERMRREWQT